MTTDRKSYTQDFKRKNYRAAFDNFDPAKVAKLMQDVGIVRNRLKINSTITNAEKILTVQQVNGSFDHYLGDLLDGKPIQNTRRTLAEIPAETERSRKMSKDLLRRGFRFVGPITCYAMMQAIGIMNDHPLDCFSHHEVQTL